MANPVNIQERVRTIRFLAEAGEPCKTAEQMTDGCCVETSELQCCEKCLDRNWRGYDEQECREGLGISDEVGIRFKTRTYPCGHLINKYDLDPKDCCDESSLTDIVYDDNNSVQILAPESSGLVYWDGGKPPYTVKIRGTGFSFDGYSLRNVITYQKYIRVFAHEMACGTAPITITDGCSSDQGSVRSTEGRWIGNCYAFSYEFKSAISGTRPMYQCWIDSGCSIQSVFLGDYPVPGSDIVARLSALQFYWDGSNWIVTGNSFAGHINQSTYNDWAGYGIPHNQHPDVYAPNGPGQLPYAICSSGCNFVC